MSFFSTFALYALALCSTAYAATRKFSIELTWASGSPDGFQRQQILVNGQSPGPALVIDQYDDVEVRLRRSEFYVLELTRSTVPRH